MVKISYIIPVYNAEAYIERCIDSILGQQNTKMEIIVVDDGSTDGTLDILHQLAEKNNNIYIFHQNNSGQGIARNFGLEKATGDYIWFIDADDWIEEAALLHVRRLLELHAPDVLFANFSTFNDETGYTGNIIPGNFANEILCPELVDDQSFFILFGWKAAPWRLIARRSLLEEHACRFGQGTLGEDHPFALQLLKITKRLYVDSLPIYVYYQRTDSSTHRQDSSIFDFIAIRKQCLALMREYGWDRRSPTLYASYLLPADFYEYHVAKSLRKEFLRRLQKDLSEQALHSIEDIISSNSKARRFLKAIRAQSPLRYELDSVWLPRLRPKTVFKQIKKGIRYVRRTLKKLRKRKHHVDPRLYQCHPSVDMTRCFIDVCMTQKNAPYLFAGEGVHLAGRFVFERGIGAVHIGRRSSIDCDTTIFCSQKKGIEIGKHVIISHKCILIDNSIYSLDADYRCNKAWYKNLSDKVDAPGLFRDWTDVKSAPIHIGDRAWIGFNSIIFGGVRIGEGAVVGCGSVVTEDIPAYTVFAGNPARFVKLAPRRGGWTKEEVRKAREAGVASAILEAMEQELGGNDAETAPCSPSTAEFSPAER